ncbi:hypothetical protein L9F63_000897, partial [Diploptera punctata]
ESETYTNLGTRIRNHEQNLEELNFGIMVDCFLFKYKMSLVNSLEKFKILKIKMIQLNNEFLTYCNLPRSVSWKERVKLRASRELIIVERVFNYHFSTDLNCTILLKAPFYGNLIRSTYIWILTRIQYNICILTTYYFQSKSMKTNTRRTSLSARKKRGRPRLSRGKGVEAKPEGKILGEYKVLAWNRCPPIHLQTFYIYKSTCYR